VLVAVVTPLLDDAAPQTHEKAGHHAQEDHTGECAQLIAPRCRCRRKQARTLRWPGAPRRHSTHRPGKSYAAPVTAASKLTRFFRVPEMGRPQDEQHRVALTCCRRDDSCALSSSTAEPRCPGETASGMGHRGRSSARGRTRDGQTQEGAGHARGKPPPVRGMRPPERVSQAGHVARADGCSGAARQDQCWSEVNSHSHC
jgi:hypothetical protein